MTSTVDIKDDSRGRPVQKAKVTMLCFLTALKHFIMVSKVCFELG